MSDVEATVQELIARLHGQKDWSAVEELVSIGEPAVRALQGALADADDSERLQAAQALGMIGAPAALAVDALSHTLSDEDPVVRWCAARALGSIGAPAAPAVAALTRALADKHSGVRRETMAALESIGVSAVDALTRASVVDALAGVLANNDSNERFWAALALCSIAEKQPILRLRGALPALRRLSRAFRVPARERRFFSEVLSEIDLATANLADVPIPAAAPAPDVSSLARATAEAPSEAELLPLPASPPDRT